MPLDGPHEARDATGTAGGAGAATGGRAAHGLWRGMALALIACVVAGAAYLAIVRADALMLDIAKIAGCF